MTSPLPADLVAAGTSGRPLAPAGFSARAGIDGQASPQHPAGPEYTWSPALASRSLSAPRFMP